MSVKDVVRDAVSSAVKAYDRAAVTLYEATHNGFSYDRIHYVGRGRRVKEWDGDLQDTYEGRFALVKCGGLIGESAEAIGIIEFDRDPRSLLIVGGKDGNPRHLQSSFKDLHISPEVDMVTAGTNFGPKRITYESSDRGFIEALAALKPKVGNVKPKESGDD